MSDTRDIITAGDAVRERDALRAEIERLTEQVRNRDYALDRLGELKDAEIERLTEAELLRATETVKLEQRIGQQEAEIEHLKALLRKARRETRKLMQD
jgi:hypothetical protein